MHSKLFLFVTEFKNLKFASVEAKKTVKEGIEIDAQFQNIRNSSQKAAKIKIHLHVKYCLKWTQKVATSIRQT